MLNSIKHLFSDLRKPLSPKLLIKPTILIAIVCVLVAMPNINKGTFAVSPKLENRGECIPVTVLTFKTDVYLPLVLNSSNNNSLPAIPSIKSVTEDTGGCLMFVGDVIHFSLDVGEVGGVANVNLGTIQSNILLYDNGTNGDALANDGIYERDYVTTPADIVRSAIVTGHFTTVDGQVANPMKASGVVTITDWEAGKMSEDPFIGEITDPVTNDTFAAGRLIIGFTESTTFEEVKEFLVAYDLTLASWIPDLMLFEIELKQGEEYDVISQQLLAEAIVEEVERNYVLELLGSPIPIPDQNMPIGQSNYLNPIRAKLGWTITKGDSSIKVATIDTGVHINHLDLAGQIEIYNVTAELNDPADKVGHGTFIAGLLAAEQGKMGISGVAPDVRLYVYKNDPLYTISNLIDIVDATREGAQVITLSICREKAILRQAINYAYDRNVVLVASVAQSGECGGNQEFFKENETGNHKVYPASFTQVLAVGSTEADDTIAPYSDFGQQVVYAPVPLSGILSTSQTGGYKLDIGTSYAAPQVAALAALIISVNPNLPNWRVTEIIIQTADDMPGEPGFGRINVYRALTVASGEEDPGSDPLPASVTNLQVSTPEEVIPQVQLSWTPPDNDYAGVHIFRRKNDNFEIVQLEGDLIPGTNYTDYQLEDGNQYSYFIFSVDETGQESVEPVESPEVFINSEMVYVPAGEFQMGCDDSNPNENCENMEQPLHTVNLDAYSIDKYEVTNEQYASFLNNRNSNDCNGYDCIFLDSNSGDEHINYWNGQYVVESGYGDHPVIMVTWYGANSYCMASGKRLPTEAEWEKAARGSNDTRKYPWGNVQANCTLANFYYGYDIGFCVGDTTPVSSYQAGASPYGALNMAGNVYEWVNDWFDIYYYSSSPYNNPSGPDTGSTKVLRGGDYWWRWHGVRVADRYDNVPTFAFHNIGFRCASSPGE